MKQIQNLAMVDSDCTPPSTVTHSPANCQTAAHPARPQIWKLIPHLRPRHAMQPVQIRDGMAIVGPDILDVPCPAGYSCWDMTFVTTTRRPGDPMTPLEQAAAGLLLGHQQQQAQEQHQAQQAQGQAQPGPDQEQGQGQAQLGVGLPGQVMMHGHNMHIAVDEGFQAQLLQQQLQHEMQEQEQEQGQVQGQEHNP